MIVEYKYHVMHKMITGFAYRENLGFSIAFFQPAGSTVFQKEDLYSNYELGENDFYKAWSLITDIFCD